MSFLNKKDIDAIADFSMSDSSDDEDISPTRNLNHKSCRNLPIRKPPINIHRLSNINDTLRNMPYSQNYTSIIDNNQTGHLSSSNIRNSNRHNRNNNRNNNQGNNNHVNLQINKKYQDSQEEIKKLKAQIIRLQKVIDIKTKNYRDISDMNKKIKDDYKKLNDEIKELNEKNENMTNFTKELKELITQYINIFTETSFNKNNQASKAKRKRPIMSSSSESDSNSLDNELEEQSDIEDNEDEDKEDDDTDNNVFPNNNKAPKDITSSIDLGNIISNKRRRKNPVRFQEQTFKNF